LNIHRYSQEYLKSLVQSSRIFQELEIGYEIEEYIGFMGPHIKKLELASAKVELKVVQKLLNYMPNLKFLYLFGLKINPNADEDADLIKLALKCTKIERIRIIILLLEIVSFCIKYLKKCAIKEMELNSLDSEVLNQFLKSQEKNLNCKRSAGLAIAIGKNRWKWGQV
jgi:hypothetical protein